MKTLESWALHAYADSELDAGERAEVERLLIDTPHAQAQLADIRHQNQAMKDAYAGVLEEPVPAALLRTARRQPVSPRYWQGWTSLAAGLALLVVGATGGWLASRYPASPQQESFVEAAVGAHEVYSRESRHVVEVAANEQDHLQTWLSKRIGVSFKVPDLSDQGYTLLGGRLLAENGKPAALLMYEDEAKRRLTVYLASNPKHTSGGFEMQQQGTFVVCSWQEPDMVYALVGSQPEAEIKKLAEVTHDRFDS